MDLYQLIIYKDGCLAKDDQLRNDEGGHEHRCRSRRRQRFLPGSNAPNSAVSLALISSVPTDLGRRHRRTDAAVSGGAAVSGSWRRAARRGGRRPRRHGHERVHRVTVPEC